MERTVDAFLLSREWRDRDSGVEVTLWARAVDVPVRARFSGLESVMFVPRTTAAHADRRTPRPLRTLQGAPVDALYFRSQRALVLERDRLYRLGYVAFESDVKPHERFLMERFITGAVRVRGDAKMRGGVLAFENPAIRAADVQIAFTVLSLDIETDGFEGPLLSAAIASREEAHVFVRGVSPARDGIVFVPTEKALLSALFEAIRAIDPDVIIGWNLVDFDLMVLEKKARAHGVPFAIGRAGEYARVLVGSTSRQVSIARVPGRVVLDGIATLKSATHHFESFTLDHVAHALLGRGKKIDHRTDVMAEIRRMYAEDIDALAAYNLEDCRLVLAIFERLGLVGFAMERARMTGLAMDRQGGSVAAFDHLYLPRLHRRGVVAPDVELDAQTIGSPGGHVLDSVPGFYRDVLSFDFRSLYPSIIRTFRIDPLGMFEPGAAPLPGEDGATFARDEKASILPALLETLHDARSRAAADGNDALARAIKILMNSFYGVLGTPACRFFDARLATSITRRGHAVIERARAFFVAKGLPVLYGDTDSLFVHVDGAPSEEDVRARGRALALELTDTLAGEIRLELDVASRLELKFEAHYLRFLMPTTRGTSRGSKKRYAGLVRDKHGKTALVVRGLEAVRSDWTPLARGAQRELLRRVFTDEPYAPWLEELARDVLRGALDHELTYTKRVRATGERSGTEDGTIDAQSVFRDAGLREGKVAYVMTIHGLEPVAHRTSPIDHAHYVFKQLAPACDVVLTALGTSFEAIAGHQLSLF